MSRNSLGPPRSFHRDPINIRIRSMWPPDSQTFMLLITSLHANRSIAVGMWRSAYQICRLNLIRQFIWGNNGLSDPSFNLLRVYITETVSFICLSYLQTNHRLIMTRFKLFSVLFALVIPLISAGGSEQQCI